MQQPANPQRIGIGLALVLGALALARPAHAALSDIRNIVVIYQENWSFDALYGSFPGANGRSNAGASATQVDVTGTAFGSPNSLVYAAGMPVLEKNVAAAVSGAGATICYLPNQPFNLASYLAPTGITTSDLPHKYYTEQLQIDGGKMDRFAVWDNTGLGLSMSYYDATNMPEGLLAQQYTLCDNFYHAAFGGSFFNHLWLVSGQPAPAGQSGGVPVVYDINGNTVAVSAANYNAVSSPYGYASPPAPVYMTQTVDANYTRDGLWAINTTQPYFQPHSSGSTTFYQVPLTTTTIGDLLTANNVTWKWYSGGWNAANLSTVTAAANLFQFHHQAFNYWAEFAPGSTTRAAHLADESQFFSDLNGITITTSPALTGVLPQVCFVKPQGPDNEHPNYASLMQGQQHVAMLVDAIQKSPYWPHTLIIITYDEHGGRWDHVAPPGSSQASSDAQAYVAANPARADVWGPGSRVPTILISPYVKRGVVDHTFYDTTSILTTIENRFTGSSRLGTRDAAVNSLELSLTADPQQPLLLGPKVQKTAFGPVPAHKGQPVCVYYEQPVSSSHWDIYNLAGQKAASLDFGGEPNPCWDPSAAAPGIYMIRSSLQFLAGGGKTVWNKVIIQP